MHPSPLFGPLLFTFFSTAGSPCWQRGTWNRCCMLRHASLAATTVCWLAANASAGSCSSCWLEWPGLAALLCCCDSSGAAPCCDSLRTDCCCSCWEASGACRWNMLLRVACFFAPAAGWDAPPGLPLLLRGGAPARRDPATPPGNAAAAAVCCCACSTASAESGPSAGGEVTIDAPCAARCRKLCSFSCLPANACRMAVGGAAGEGAAFRDALVSGPATLQP